MIRVRAAATADTPRRIPEFWRKTGLALATLVVCEIGARIVAPGLNAQVLRDFLRGESGGWLLRVYDWVVGGALSRGAVLAIGIMPYVSARIFMRLARTFTRSNADVPSDAAERQRRTITRWLTGGLALVQSYGFAQFVQGIPGAVSNPGFAFLAKTVAVLTAGSIGAMLLSERLTRPRADDDSVVDDAPTVPTDDQEPRGAGDRLLSAGQLPEEWYRPHPDPETVRREPNDAERRND